MTNIDFCTKKGAESRVEVSESKKMYFIHDMLRRNASKTLFLLFKKTTPWIRGGRRIN